MAMARCRSPAQPLSGSPACSKANTSKIRVTAVRAQWRVKTIKTSRFEGCKNSQ